jgi:hypothetical protein
VLEYFLTLTTQYENPGDNDGEEDAHFEASHTKVSLPSVTSQGEEKVEKKRKRTETVFSK